MRYKVNRSRALLVAIALAVSACSASVDSPPEAIPFASGEDVVTGIVGDSTTTTLQAEQSTAPATAPVEPLRNFVVTDAALGTTSTSFGELDQIAIEAILEDLNSVGAQWDSDVVGISTFPIEDVAGVTVSRYSTLMWRTDEANSAVSVVYDLVVTESDTGTRATVDQITFDVSCGMFFDEAIGQDRVLCGE